MPPSTLLQRSQQFHRNCGLSQLIGFLFGDVVMCATSSHHTVCPQVCERHVCCFVFFTLAALACFLRTSSHKSVWLGFGSAALRKEKENNATRQAAPERQIKGSTHAPSKNDKGQAIKEAKRHQGTNPLPLLKKKTLLSCHLETEANGPDTAAPSPPRDRGQ